MLRGLDDSCTGYGGMAFEDDKDYCIGWQLNRIGSNCNQTAEYK